VTDITHTIQLAVAPVFLLTALGTLLSVLSTRLGRIVDRARVLVDRMGGYSEPQRARAQHELVTLARRRRLVNRAITSCVIAAVLVCLLIAAAFVSYIVSFDLARFLAGLFIAAITAFTVGLLYFLREILVAVDHASIVTDSA
jgi:MFS family permease